MREREGNERTNERTKQAIDGMNKPHMLPYTPLSLYVAPPCSVEIIFFKPTNAANSFSRLIDPQPKSNGERNTNLYSAESTDCVRNFDECSPLAMSSASVLFGLMIFCEHRAEPDSVHSQLCRRRDFNDCCTCGCLSSSDPGAHLEARQG